MINLLVCHLIGDFLLQNHWMQGKSSSYLKCTVHVLCYSIPFLILFLFGGMSSAALLLIVVQHWFQDRFQLHMLWMRLMRQSPPDKWPAGPLFVDQVWHITWIWFVFTTIG